MSYLLDISRTISRIAAGPKTGIDRVELAYIRYFLDTASDTRFLAKVGQNFAVLDAVTVRKLLDAEAQGNWPKARGVDRFRFKLEPHQRRTRSFVRQIATFFGKLDNAKQALSGCRTYYNVGHTNLSDGVFKKLRQFGIESVNVLVHDMIPLDFPQYTRTDTIQTFQHRMRAVSKHADRIICNSNYTRDRVNHWFSSFGRAPKQTVAYLGLEQEFLEPVAKKQNDTRATFLVLGTIEPRKNHMLLLKIWKQLANQLPKTDMPELVIVGRRGWQNEEVFSVLDQSPLMGVHIFEHNSMSDADLKATVASASALLFPSFVEGYGLPALEAMAQNRPVICSDIPVFRELLGDYGQYASPDNAEAWKENILNSLNIDKKITKLPSNGDNGRAHHTWDDHFGTVFRGLGDQNA